MMDYNPNRKRNKVGIAAPCAFEEWSEPKQKLVTKYPPVGCTQECDSCGWNPEVAKKRIEKLLTKKGR